jgi:aspartyl protease family protein
MRLIRSVHCIAALAAICGWLATPAMATDVVLAGLFTNRALVQINGGAPRMLSPGQPPVEGVVLLSVSRTGATFEVDGQRRDLTLGQGNHGGSGGSRASVTLSADPRGHFITEGMINGAPVRFVLDTGATLVSLSQAEAQRLGIDASRGERVNLGTANGSVSARRITLQSVRVGAINVSNVDAVVVDNLNMPALLGMSFLNRMDMRREGQVMTLTLRN